MKKLIFTLALVVSMGGALRAQVEGSTLGLRFGYGGEISFQSALGHANRLELDLGLNRWGSNYYYNNYYYSSGIALTAVYQWVWNLNALAPGFDWYAGLGGTLGSFGSTLGLGLVGQIGLEYNFTIPLQLSLDYRPAVFFIYPHDSYGDTALSLRYRF